ncbi:type IV secretion system protein [Bartonella phoceensis]
MPQTYRFFEQWIIKILSYIIFFILLATIFNLIRTIFVNYRERF